MADVEAVAARHQEWRTDVESGVPGLIWLSRCETCGVPWPCDAAQAVEALRELRDAASNYIGAETYSAEAAALSKLRLLLRASVRVEGEDEDIAREAELTGNPKEAAEIRGRVEGENRVYEDGEDVARYRRLDGRVSRSVRVEGER